MEYEFKLNRIIDMWQPSRGLYVRPEIGDTLVFKENHTSVEYICAPSSDIGCDPSCGLRPDRPWGICCRQIDGMLCTGHKKFIAQTQVEDLI